MAGKDLPLRIDAGSDGLRQPRTMPPASVPQRLPAPDDHGFERVKQPAGPIDGSKLARMPKATAATTETAREMPTAAA